MRVVLDTNIVVSAMLRAGSLPDVIFNLAIDCVIRLYVSEPILAEYAEVLRRPRLRLDPEKVTTALARIREASTLVHPSAPATAASDPDDNIFLECVEAADADYLVTGNSSDFPATWFNARIVTPRQLLEAFAQSSAEDPSQ